MANSTQMKSNKDNPFGTEPRKPGDTGSSMGHKVEEAKDYLTDKAKDAASTVADKASAMADKASDMAGSVKQGASQAVTAVGDKATQGVSAMGSGMQSLAGTIRENVPHSGMMGSASTSVADSLERGGRYLQEEGLKGIADDVTDLVRKNPIPALLIGIGLGFILARATSRS